VARAEELVGRDARHAASDGEAGRVADELARVVAHEVGRADRARQPCHRAVRVDHLGRRRGGGLAARGRQRQAHQRRVLHSPRTRPRDGERQRREREGERWLERERGDGNGVCIRCNRSSDRVAEELVRCMHAS
jgi:hypothetical protein